MRIPDEVFQSVVFVGAKGDGKFRPLGTAFLVAGKDRGIFAWAVTARHVIEGTLRQIGSGVFYPPILIRTNTIHQQAPFMMVRPGDVFVHPGKRYIDVAVIRYAVTSDGAHRTLNREYLFQPFDLNRYHIGPGSAVFMAGLFSGHSGERTNIPIVRLGNVAALPKEPIITKRGEMEGYLIETKSIGGHSGSPAYVCFAGDDPALFGLLGLVKGHFNETDSAERKMNRGISIVVPAFQILETIEAAESGQATQLEVPWTNQGAEES